MHIDEKILNQLVPIVVEHTGRSERAFDIFSRYFQPKGVGKERSIKAGPNWVPFFWVTFQ